MGVPQIIWNHKRGTPERLNQNFYFARRLLPGTKVFSLLLVVDHTLDFKDTTIEKF